MTVEDRPQHVTIASSSVVEGVGIVVNWDVQAQTEVAVLYSDDLQAKLNTDYSVTLQPGYKSALVVPMSGLVEKANGGKITIRSAIPYVQGWSVPINSRLAENDLQRTEDRDVMRDRQLAERLDLSLSAFANNPTSLDARGRRISNLSAGLEPDDAARVQDVDEIQQTLDDVLAGQQPPTYRDTATVISAMTTPVANAPDFFRVTGRSAVGDGGEGVWKREIDVAGVTPALKFTIGANIYINRSRKLRPEEAGAKGTGMVGDATANVAAFNSALGSTEHRWITLDKPALYKFDAPLVLPKFINGLVLEMHPEAELDFSLSGSTDPALTISGTLGTGTPLTDNVLKGSNLVPVTSTVGFVVGQGAKLLTGKFFNPQQDGEKYAIAELGIVDAIVGSSIRLVEPAQLDDYLVTDGASLTPVSLCGRVRIIGGRMRGNPAVLAQALRFHYGLGLIIEGTHFVDFDSRAIGFRDSIKGKIDNIDVYGDEVIGGGTGYGVSMWGSARDLKVVHSTFRRCRHAFTTNNDDTLAGIPFNGTVFDCTISSTAEVGNDALDTHTCAGLMRFLYNTISDSKGHGIHVECPWIDIIGNRVYRSANEGIIWINEAGADGRARIDDNWVEESGQKGIYFSGASHGSTSAIERLICSGNQVFRSGEDGIHLEDSTTGGRAIRVDILNNYVDGYNVAAISLEQTDRFLIKGNQSKNPANTISNGVRLTDCKTGKVLDETHGLVAPPDAAKLAVRIIATAPGASSDILIGGDTTLNSNDASGFLGSAVSADDNCTNIIVERGVRAIGFGKTASLGTSPTNKDKTLLEPFNLVIADDQVASFALPANFYAQVLINARSGAGTSPHGIFSARGSGTPFAFDTAGLSNCDFVTGALAPAAGVDGKFTISADNSNRVYFSNRTGATLTVDLEMMTS